MNLFLALLLASFGSNVLIEKEDDDDKIAEAIDRIKRFLRSFLRIKQGEKNPQMKDEIKNEILADDQVCASVYHNILCNCLSLETFCSPRSNCQSSTV